jgi:hypothetical protein
MNVACPNVTRKLQEFLLNPFFGQACEYPYCFQLGTSHDIAFVFNAM